MIYCKQLHTNATIRAQEHEVVYCSRLQSIALIGQGVAGVREIVLGHGAGCRDAHGGPHDSRQYWEQVLALVPPPRQNVELTASVTISALPHLSIGDLVLHVRLVLIVDSCVEGGGSGIVTFSRKDVVFLVVVVKHLIVHRNRQAHLLPDRWSSRWNVFFFVIQRCVLDHRILELILGLLDPVALNTKADKMGLHDRI